MKRNLVFLLAGVVVLLLVGLILSGQRSKSAKALAAYKANLKAQGEILTWSDLGYPRPAESNDCFPRLVQAVNRIGQRSLSPGTIRLMDLSSPTHPQAAWLKTNLNRSVYNEPNLTWSALGKELDSIREPLAEIRAALEYPATRFLTDPTNLIAGVQFQFVEQRNAAQWLGAELIFALHEQNLPLVWSDLHALTQLVHLHGEDPTLVNQMIRAAVSGLALAGTWEALQAPGWREEELAAMQSDWERIDLFRNLELGLLGERLFSENIFEQISQMTSRAQVQYFNKYVGPTGNQGFRYYWEVLVVTPLWRMNREEDELLCLRVCQNSLDAVRALRRGTNWSRAKRDLDLSHASVVKALGGPMGRIRYSVSGILIPNLTRAAQTVTRHETLRRMAVTAIALQRYRLRTQTFPATLEALVPDLVSSIPIDPMSGKPLCYRTKQDGYLLYSVGEDGVDDGGDPTPPVATSGKEIWDGRDFVWPSLTSTNR